jgi:hypothetical protein
MDAIETYAVGLVEAGAAYFSQDDMDESGEFDDEQEWRKACDLGKNMAGAIKRNPESFLRWYRETALAEAVR